MVTLSDTYWEPSLLTDLTLLHINTNRFYNTVQHKFDKLKLPFELDLSNNCFVRKFPDVVLCLSQLKFLDMRFIKFKGTVLKELFDKDLDAIFINDNRFIFNLLENLKTRWCRWLCWRTTVSKDGCRWESVTWRGWMRLFWWTMHSGYASLQR